MALKCIIQFRYITEAFSLYIYRDIARCRLDHALSLNRIVPEPSSGAGYVVEFEHSSIHSELCYIHTQESVHACNGEGSALQCIHYDIIVHNHTMSCRLIFRVCGAIKL